MTCIFVIIAVLLFCPFASARCQGFALGMENNAIPNNKITSSSGMAFHARLNRQGPSWCASTEANPYLQIDLETPHIICAVSTQGDPIDDKWVETFQLSSSVDGISYTPYKDLKQSSPREFYANVDRSGIVKQNLYKGIFARYLRVLPEVHNAAKCMRVELYGMNLQTKNVAFKKRAQQANVIHGGVASRAVDGNRDGNYWISLSCTHCDETDGTPLNWWRVDLGTSIDVEEISIFNRVHDEYGLRLWTYLIEVRVGQNTADVKSNPKCGGQYGVLAAGNITIVCNPAMSGRFVIITQDNKDGRLSLCEVEVYAKEPRSTTVACTRKPLGVNGNSPSDVIYTSSSSFSSTRSANNAELLGRSSWRPRDGDLKPWLKLAFRGVRYVCALATQGDPNSNERTKTYKIKWSLDNTKWKESEKLSGNRDNTSIIKHIFPSPLLATKILIIPVERNAAFALRVQVYGVALASRRPLTIETTIQAVQPGFYADLVCKADRGFAVQWFFEGGDVTSRSNGTIFYRELSISKLRINYTSADDVCDSYRKFCNTWKSSGQKVIQFTANYTCKVEYGTHSLVRVGSVMFHMRPPQTPTNLRTSRWSRSVILAWTQPKRKHDEWKIKSYKIRFSNQTRDQIILTQSNKTLYNLSFLAPYTLYSAKVMAVSRLWESEWSAALPFTTRQGAPSAPRNFRGLVNSQYNFSQPTVSFTWDEPTVKNGIISSYILSGKFAVAYKKDLTSSIVKEVKRINCTINVIGGGQFEFWLRAKTVTVGAASEMFITTIPECRPSAGPRKIKAQFHKNRLNITWEEIPPEKSNGKIVNYEIRIQAKNQETEMESNVKPLIVYKASPPYISDNSTEHAQYVIKIRGYTSIGYGPWNTSLVTLSPLSTASAVKDESGKNAVSLPVAIGISFLVIVLIVIVISVYYYKRRTFKPHDLSASLQGNRPNRKQGENSMEMHYVEGPGEKGFQVNKRDSYYGSIELTSDGHPGPISVNDFFVYFNTAKENDFSELKEQFEGLKKDCGFSKSVAMKSSNKQKNRYDNIVPYDRSRVVLEPLDKDQNSDYINASYITGFDGKQKAYIATQGPVSETANDFWRMIWQEKTMVIIMLTSVVQGKKVKCHKYWPDVCESYSQITVKLQKTDDFCDYTIRTFIISKINSKEQRYVYQYHYTAWPTKGVPEHASAVLAFRNTIIKDGIVGYPWVVHCSAGVGRTGAFIVIDAMLRQAEESQTVDILNYLRKIRQDRPNLCLKLEHYVFAHTAVLEALHCGNTEIQAQDFEDKMLELSEVDRRRKMSGFEIEFENLCMVCPGVRDDETKHGKRSCNYSKNRFPHILPLDKSRVILHADTKKEKGSDYINASYANGYRQKKAYVLTQAPLQNTIADFWQMIYENKLPIIVMLYNQFEDEKNYPMYWSDTKKKQYGNITVENVKEEYEQHDYVLVIRTFSVKSVNKTEEHKVKHFHFLKWNEQSLPEDTESVLFLMESVQQWQQQTENSPIVVQCSDGTGHSGTFCTIFTLIERVKTEQMIDVFEEVKALRLSRPGVVENCNQYKFCYQMVGAFLDSFCDYSNF